MNRVSAEESSWNILEIEQMLVRRGLPFLLEHPGQSIFIYIKERGKRFRKLLVVLLIVFVVGIYLAPDFVGPFTVSGSGSIEYGKYFFYAFWFALALVIIFMLWRIWRAIIPVLKLWARVGSTLALMFSFVTLYFFTGDAWRFLGGVQWWRLIAFACFFAAIALPLLYSHANRAVQGAENESRDDPAKFMMATNRVFPDTFAELPKRQDLPSDGLAGFNVRAVVTLLLARRILVSGFIVLLVLLFLGLVMIDQHATKSLMYSPSVVGWSVTLGIDGHGFFLSEALVKVAVSVGGLAAVYFVVITVTDDAWQTPNTEETVFIHNASVLWSCYKGRPTRPDSVRDAVTPSSD